MANKYIREGATYNGDGLSSAVASGATVTFTIASPGKVNWTGHGLAANALVYFGVTSGGVLPTGITAGTTYYVRNPGTDDFEVSATSGGASINFSGTPSGTATCTTTGAWNHINILVGTAINTISGGTQGGGAVAAGDTVYMRSKTSAGADITFTGTKTVGSSSATLASPITWVLDAGTVWSGISGVLTFSCGQYERVAVVAYNSLLADSTDAVVITTSSSSRGNEIAEFRQLCGLRNIKIDLSLEASNVNAYHVICHGVGLIENLHVVGANVVNGKGLIYVGANYYWYLQSQVFINPHIELNRAGYTGTGVIFANGGTDGSGGAITTIIGGKVTGAAASEGYWSLAHFLSQSGRIDVFGLSFPKALPALSSIVTTGTNYADSVLSIVGADDGYGSVFGNNRQGYFDSRNLTYNYPVLNAVLPDTASTGWSWRGLPKLNLSASVPLVLPIAKFFVDTADTKTVTMELQLSDTIASSNIDRSKIWMTVSYTKDSDGDYVTETTKLNTAGTALDVSYAEWDKNDWGAVTMDNYKLALTTQNAIAQDSMVIATLFWTVPSGGASDMFFVCPDLTLS